MTHGQGLIEIKVPAAWATAKPTPRPVPVAKVPEYFVEGVMRPILAQKGDTLPVSRPSRRERLLPVRHFALRKTRRGHQHPPLDQGKLHPVQPVLVCVPPRHHPAVSGRRGRNGHGAGLLRHPAGHGQGAQGPCLPHAGLPHGLHGLRFLRRRLPGQAEGPGHEAPGSRGDRAGRELRLCHVAQEQGRPGQTRKPEGQPVPAAAARILGRLRRLRRDALRQAPHPAFWRTHDGGQRHGLLLDLGRLRAHLALRGQRRRPWPGLEQLAVRGRGRIRLWLQHGAHPAPQQAGRQGHGPPWPDRCPTPCAPPWPVGSRKRTTRPVRASTATRQRPCSTRPIPSRRPSPPTPTSSPRSPCGSSAATAGPTTSATAASTTSSPRARTSTSWSWTPKSIPTPAVRPPRPPRSGPSPSSPRPARSRAKRIWPAWP